MDTEEGDTLFIPLPSEEPEEAKSKGSVSKRRCRGRVRWYSRSLGYGFLREDGRSNEIFVHQTSLQMPGVKNLRSGQRVIFELCEFSYNAKPLAINVIPIMEKPEALARQRLKKLENNS